MTNDIAVCVIIINGIADFSIIILICIVQTTLL